MLGDCRQKNKRNAMAEMSKVKSVELLACDAGWRNYHFVKITTEDGIVGWSEFDEGFGSPGVGAAIERLSARVVDRTPFSTSASMPSSSRQRGPRPGVSSRKRWAQSKTPCST
jgi:L-alanine-DL-glutamate epimerase-like enolase superfamily enzyme